MPLPFPLHNLINQPVVARIRRNHGLEHATIHVLTETVCNRGRIAGHSDAGGFWLFGDLNQEEISVAVDEALRRLRAGQRHLAIHPNCGTNLVTSGILAGTAGAVAMTGANSSRDRLGRLPFAAFFATLALLLSRPLGTRLQQRLTTSGDPGNLEILSIEPRPRGSLMVHRVSTLS